VLNEALNKEIPRGEVRCARGADPQFLGGRDEPHRGGDRGPRGRPDPLDAHPGRGQSPGQARRPAPGRHPADVGWPCSGIWTPMASTRAGGWTSSTRPDGRWQATGEVLRLAARHQLVVATGHLSAYESRVVAEAAFEAGVRHVIATHPNSPSRTMSRRDQLALAGQGAFLERCFHHPVHRQVRLGRMADNIRATRRRAHHHHHRPRPAATIHR